MLEESVSMPSIWASMNSWFTPTVLFVFINVVIGTIYFTSSFAAEDERQPPERLVRSPSLLQRLKSINLYTHGSQKSTPLPSISTHFKLTSDSDTHYAQEQTHQQQTLETATPYVFQQSYEQESQNTETQFVPEQTLDEGGEEEEQQTMDEIYSQFTDRHVSRTKSDTEPASGEVPAKLPTKMRKSASTMSSFSHFEEEDLVEARRPATMREGRDRATEVDEEVDAKADDFINRFREQLTLQRLNSFRRYTEMVTRRSAK